MVGSGPSGQLWALAQGLLQLFTTDGETWVQLTSLHLLLQWVLRLFLKRALKMQIKDLH